MQLHPKLLAILDNFSEHYTCHVLVPNQGGGGYVYFCLIKMSTCPSTNYIATDRLWHIILSLYVIIVTKGQVNIGLLCC